VSARATAAAASAAVVAVVAVVMVLAGCGAGERPPAGTTPGPTPGTPSGSASSPRSTAPVPPPAPPLRGRVVVLDPGHRLGNARFPAEIGRRVDAGGFTKACNTTGTATDDGYPEATFAWQVATEVRRRLRRLGARVVLTRDDDAATRWGPCIDDRGTRGNPGEPGPTADVRVSIHGDGVRAGSTGPRRAHGFHVIRPGERAGWTDDIAVASRGLAVAVRDALVAAGLTPSTYRGRDGIDVRTDLGTLNHSDVPAVMAELGNMRDPRDAAVMASAAGRERYARALVAGIRAYLDRPG